jgi:hypothetical protein
MLRSLVTIRRKLNVVSLELSEVTGAILAPITVLVGYLHLKIAGLKKDQGELRDKIAEAYTKDETKEMIHLMVGPIKETTERLIESQSKLVDALSRLEVQIAKYAK